MLYTQLEKHKLESSAFLGRQIMSMVLKDDDDIIRLSNSCWRLVLHLVRFHCISGEVKVVEGPVSLGICDYTGMATGRQPLEVVCITIMEPHIRC